MSTWKVSNQNRAFIDVETRRRYTGIATYPYPVRTDVQIESHQRRYNLVPNSGRFHACHRHIQIE